MVWDPTNPILVLAEVGRATGALSHIGQLVLALHIVSWHVIAEQLMQSGFVRSTVFFSRQGPCG